MFVQLGNFDERWVLPNPETSFLGWTKVVALLEVGADNTPPQVMPSYTWDNGNTVWNTTLTAQSSGPYYP